MPSHRQEAPADSTIHILANRTRVPVKLRLVAVLVFLCCIPVSVNGGKDAVTQAGGTSSRPHNPHPGKTEHGS
jgi:hypothetical protein